MSRSKRRRTGRDGSFIQLAPDHPSNSKGEGRRARPPDGRETGTGQETTAGDRCSVEAHGGLSLGTGATRIVGGICPCERWTHYPAPFAG